MNYEKIKISLLHAHIQDEFNEINICTKFHYIFCIYNYKK